MSPPSDDRERVLAAVKNLAELGGADFVYEMIGLLRTQTPDQFRQIEEALSKGDIATAQRMAHSMKSSFGNFGALECQQIATAMDLAGKDCQLDVFQREYAKIRPAFDRLQPWLDEAIDTIG
jgi:HPt (histidine-containing phosphotransfer) domain-containing protein